MSQPSKISLAAMLASVTSENRSEFRPHASHIGAEVIDWGDSEQDVQSDLHSVTEGRSQKNDPD